jgi:hypothetical protein
MHNSHFVYNRGTQVKISKKNANNKIIKKIFSFNKKNNLWKNFILDSSILKHMKKIIKIITL